MAAREKSKLIAEAKKILKDAGVPLKHSGVTIEGTGIDVTDASTTHEQRVERLLALMLEVLIDIRENETNPS